MPFATILNDPDFRQLQPGEQRKVLAAVDDDFASLPVPEQQKALFVLTESGGADSAEGGQSSPVGADGFSTEEELRSHAFPGVSFKNDLGRSGTRNDVMGISSSKSRAVAKRGMATAKRLAADAPKFMAAGVGNTVQTIGQGLDFVGLDTAGKKLKEVGQETRGYWTGQIDPESQRIQEVPVYDERTGEFNWDVAPEKFLTGALQSAPDMVAAIIPTTFAIAGLSKLGTAAKIAAGARKLGVGEKAAEYIGGYLSRGVAAGGVEGIQAGLGNSAETERRIREAPLEQLMDLPEFQQEYSRTGADLSDEQRAEMARDALANRAAVEVLLKTIPTTAGLGMLTGGGATGMVSEKLAGRIAARELAKESRRGMTGFLKNAGEGVVEESFQEGLQSPAEQVIQNVAEQKYLDRTIRPMTGVVNAAVEGAGSGGVLGLAGGSGAHLAQRSAVSPSEIPANHESYTDVTDMPAPAGPLSRAVNHLPAPVSTIRVTPGGEALTPAQWQPEVQTPPGLSAEEIAAARARIEAPPAPAKGMVRATSPAATTNELVLDEAREWAAQQVKAGNPSLMQQRGENAQAYAQRLVTEYGRSRQTEPVPTVQPAKVAEGYSIPAAPVAADSVAAVAPVVEPAPVKADPDQETLAAVTDADRASLTAAMERARAWEKGTRTNGRSNKAELFPWLAQWGKTTPAEVSNAIGAFLGGKKLGTMQAQLVAAAIRGEREMAAQQPAGVGIHAKAAEYAREAGLDIAGWDDEDLAEFVSSYEVFRQSRQSEIDARAHEAAASPQNDLPEPTEAQKDVGNYKKGHLRLHGLDISVENPAGSVRRGTGPDGKPWETELAHHYGYIKGTVGRDKDHIDVFIGDRPGSESVYVVDQVDPKTGDFDEHKVLLGFESPEAAREGYLANYDASGAERIGALTEVAVTDFKQWLKGGKTAKPFRGIDVKKSDTGEGEAGTAGTTEAAGERVPEVSGDNGERGAGVPVLRADDEVKTEAKGESDDLSGVREEAGSAEEVPPVREKTEGETVSAAPEEPAETVAKGDERDSQPGEAPEEKAEVTEGVKDSLTTQHTPEKTEKRKSDPQRIEDVGENLWFNRRNVTGRGISWADVKDLNDTLKTLEVVKTKVWPRPDYEQLVADGMHPFFARLVKQAYDGIALKPAGTTDADLERYIAVVGRVRDAVFEWAKDAEANRDFMDKVVAGFRAAVPGQVTSITSMLDGSTKISDVFLTRIWPEEMAKSGYARFGRGTEANAEVLAIGGNRALKALQPDRQDIRRVVDDLSKGWPGKQEAWQRQGFRVVEKTAAEIETRYRLESGERVPVYHVEIEGRYQGSFAGREEARQFIDGLSPWLLMGKGRRIEGEFQTREEAEAAAREKVTRSGGSGRDFRGMNVTEAERTGPARRGADEDVTAERLMETFGFRGVNFGREGWINQAERQAYLNHAYDGLHDLAEIMGVPPAALSLNGTLGIAFGAQGRGGTAAAHFVPGLNEINLTKTMGAGTLAHEWGHALDHYFAVQAGLGRDAAPYLSESGRKAGEDIRPEILAAFREIVEAMTRKPMAPEELENRKAAAVMQTRRNIAGWLKTIRRQLEALPEEKRAAALGEFDQLAERIGRGDVGEGYAQAGKQMFTPVVAQVRNLFRDATGRLLSLEDTKGLDQNARSLRYALNDRAADKTHVPQMTSTAYKKESLRKDGEKKGKAYWATMREMFARAFESYVSSRLAELAQVNTFLSDADLRAQARHEDGAYVSPYPRNEELTTINAAFGRLVESLEVRQEDGRQALFSRTEVNDIDAAFNDDVDKLVAGTITMHHVFDLGRPSQILMDTGVPDLPIRMKLSTARKVTGMDAQGRHDLPSEMLYNLPRHINNPVAVFSSDTQSQAKTLLLQFRHNGQPVMAAVHLEEKLGNLEVNEIASVYERNEGNYVNWVLKGRLESLDKKKGQWLLERVRRAIRPQTSGSLTPNKILFHQSEDVKSGVREDRSKTARFAIKQNQRRSLPDVEFDAVFERVTAGLTDADRGKLFSVVDSFADLPAAIQQEAGKQGAAGKSVDGVYHRGKVYIVRENIASAERLEEVLFHEWHGHAGLDRLFDGKVRQAMRDLYRQVGAGELFRIGRKYGINLMQYGQGMVKAGYDLDTRQAIMAEEMLAHLAGEFSKPSTPAHRKIARMIREVIGAVRAWLREKGFARMAEWGETDIVWLLKRARAYAAAGVGQASQTETVFATYDDLVKRLAERGVTEEQLRMVLEYAPKFAAAWHGSPHDFDRFSTGAIGTGEGAQAYGYGLYFAGNKEVAEFYRKGLSVRDFIRKAREAYDQFDDPTEAAAALRRVDGLSEAQRELIDALEADDWLGFDYPHQAISAAFKSPDNYEMSERTRESLARQGRLYQVELVPEEDEYLLWDKPLSEQSEKVKAALAEYGDYPQNWTGGEIYTSETGGRAGNINSKIVSDDLHSLGIRGIKYLDGSSRSKGEGHYNYVIFDDRDVQVTAKFALRKEVDEAVEKVSPAGTLARLRNIMNPMDWSRFHQKTSEALSPEMKLWLSDNLMTPLWRKETDPASAPFYDEFREREEKRFENNIRMFGGLLDKEGKKLSDWLKKPFDWSSHETAWQKLRREHYEPLSDAEKAAYDVLRFEGDAYNKTYAKLEDALLNPRIKKAGMNARVFEFYRQALEAEDAAFEVKIQIARENMAEAGVDPEKIEGHIAEYRAKFAEIRGWVHRDHGEGSYVVQVRRVIDRLDFDVDTVQVETEASRERGDSAKSKDHVPEYETADRIRLPYFPGHEVRNAIEKIVREMGGSFKQTRNGALIVLLKEGDGAKALKRFNAIALKNDKGEAAKVLVYNRFVPTEKQAKKLEREVKGNLAAAMPRGFREGHGFETEWKFSDKIQEYEHQALQTSDMELERVLVDALKKAKAKGELEAEEFDAVQAAVVQNVAETLLGRGAGLYQIRRAEYLIEGYELDDAMGKYENYVNGVAGMFSKARYALHQYKNLREVGPKLRPWAFRYVEDSLRNMGAADRLSGDVRAFASLWYLGFNLSWMLVNSTQPYTFGQAELSRHTAGATRKIAAAEKDIVTGRLTEEEKGLFDKTEVLSQERESFQAELTGQLEGVGGKVSKALHTGAQVSMAWGQKIEVLNRRTIILAAYRIFRGKGLAADAALEKAMEVNSLVNIDMGRHNLPRFARNAAGRTIYTLQSYIQHALNYLYHRGTSGKTEDQRAILRLLFAMFLIGGVPAGAPGSDEIDKIIRKLFGYSPKLALRTFTRRFARDYGTTGEMLDAFVWRGVPGALKPLGVGFSLTGSVQFRLPIISNVIAGDDMAKSLTGAVGGLGQKLWIGGRQALRGDWSRAVEYLAPTSLASILSGVRQATEGVRTSHGKPVFYKGQPLRMTPAEGMIRAAGLQPVRTADVQETRGVEKEIRSEWNERRQDALDEYRFSGGRQGMKRFNRELRGSQAAGLVSPISSESLARSRGKADRKATAWERQHGLD